MLSDDEIDALRREAKETSVLFKKAFACVNPSDRGGEGPFIREHTQDGRDPG